MLFNNAWFGPADEFFAVLFATQVQTENGNILIWGERPAFGYGGDEVVVPSGCKVRVDGVLVQAIFLLAEKSNKGVVTCF